MSDSWVFYMQCAKLMWLQSILLVVDVSIYRLPWSVEIITNILDNETWFIFPKSSSLFMSAWLINYFFIL